MELIRKSDAMHAVLHHKGDAAVAAVQAIKPINPHGELREMLIDAQIDNYKIYGYKVRDLILFADMCKRNDVQEADLKQAAWNLELAVRAYHNATIENFRTWEDEKGIHSSARYVPNFEKAYAEMQGKVADKCVNGHLHLCYDRDERKEQADAID